MRAPLFLLLATALCLPSTVFAENTEHPASGRAPAPSPAPLAPPATGDSWIVNDRTYRLFGVQACILGQLAITIRNERLDCGAVSRAALAALLTNGATECRSVDSRPKFDYLTCSLTINSRKEDLGAAMIASGYAFAAVAPNPKDNRVLIAINPFYADLERTAQRARAGLWGYKSMPHPTKTLANAYFRTRQ